MFIIIRLLTYINLDPITEIINSGQAFMTAIALERILWVMIGFFLLGAISTSTINGKKHQDWFGNISFFSFLKVIKRNDKFPKKLFDD